jgi:hypothetical protein
MSRLSKILIAAAATFAVPASSAFAQDPAPTEGEAGAEVGGEAGVDASGTAAVDSTATPDAAMAPAGALPPLTLGKGKILIAGETVNINLSADSVGKPVSLAPSVWYGVSDKLSVGLTHDAGTTPWTPRPALRTITVAIPGAGSITGAAGSGICLTGSDNGCNKVYDNVGADALFGLADAKFSLAAHPGLDVFSIDEGTLQLRLGVLGRYAASDKLNIVFDPRISIGLTDRDFVKESIDVPVWVWFKANEQLGAYVSTGIAGPLDGFGDAFSVPLGLGASYMVDEKLTVGGDFQFLNLIGKNSSADGRMLGLRAAYAL